MKLNKRAVGQRLADFRREQQLSMATVAETVGVAGKGTVNDWEKGRSLPSRERLTALAKLYQVSPDYLRYGPFNDYAFEILKTDGMNSSEFNVLLWEYVDLTTTNPGILSGDVFNQATPDTKSIDAHINGAITQILPSLPQPDTHTYPDTQVVVQQACDAFRERIQLIRRTFTGKYNRIVRLLDNVDLYEKLGDDPDLRAYLDAMTATTGGYAVDRAYQQKMNLLLTNFHQQLNSLNDAYHHALITQANQTKTNDVSASR